MLVAFSVLSRILSNSTANLFQKKASEYAFPEVTNLYSCLFMSLICLIPACFVDWSIYPSEFWINVIIAGILCTIGTLALIEALKIGELSVLAPINSFKSIIGLVSAFILLKEIPSLTDFICVLFIMLGSYFVLDTGEEKFSIKTLWRKDVRLRFFALLCSGIEAAILKKIIIMSSFSISLILWCFSGFLCAFFVVLIKKSDIKMVKKNYYNCGIIGIMLLIMQLATNYVFSKIEVGVALSLFQLSSLVSLAFGYKFYNEKDIPKKLLGTIIMILSSVFIFTK